MRYYRSLEGLRGVAATVVVVTHVAFWTGNYTDDALGRVFARGDVGVALFFVLSGFLLSRPFLAALADGAPPPSTVRYLGRRALRILPAYWLAVLAALVLLPGNRGAGPGEWLGYLGLLQVYGPNWAGAGLVHTWSLCAEAAFYLVLPAAVPWLSGATWRPDRILARLGAVALAGLVWLGVATAIGPDLVAVGPLNLWLPAFAGWFGAGIALAVLTVAGEHWRPRVLARALAASPGTCWAGAAVLFWLAATPLGGPLGLDAPTVGAAVTKNVLYAGVAALVVLPLVLCDRDDHPGARFLSSAPALWVGRISYGIFLYHMAVLTGGFALFGKAPFTGGMIPVLVLTWGWAAALAAVSHRLVEDPVARWGRRLLTRSRPGSARPSAPAPAAVLAVGEPESSEPAAVEPPRQPEPAAPEPVVVEPEEAEPVVVEPAEPEPAEPVIAQPEPEPVIAQPEPAAALDLDPPRPRIAPTSVLSRRERTSAASPSPHRRAGASAPRLIKRSRPRGR